MFQLHTRETWVREGRAVRVSFRNQNQGCHLSHISQESPAQLPTILGTSNRIPTSGPVVRYTSCYGATIVMTNFTIVSLKCSFACYYHGTWHHNSTDVTIVALWQLATGSIHNYFVFSRKCYLRYWELLFSCKTFWWKTHIYHTTKVKRSFSCWDVGFQSWWTFGTQLLKNTCNFTSSFSV